MLRVTATARQSFDRLLVKPLLKARHLIMNFIVNCRSLISVFDVQACSESAVCCHPEPVEGFVCWPINHQLQFFKRMKLLMKAVSLKMPALRPFDKLRVTATARQSFLSGRVTASAQQPFDKPRVTATARQSFLRQRVRAIARQSFLREMVLCAAH